MPACGNFLYAVWATGLALVVLARLKPSVDAIFGYARACQIADIEVLNYQALSRRLKPDSDESAKRKRLAKVEKPGLLSARRFRKIGVPRVHKEL
jgi:hypothetical protein